MDRFCFCCVFLFIPAISSQAQGLFGGNESGSRFGSAFNKSSATSPSKSSSGDAPKARRESAGNRFIGRGQAESALQSTPASAGQREARSPRSTASSSELPPSKSSANLSSTIPGRRMFQPRQRIAFQFDELDRHAVARQLARRFSHLASQIPSFRNVTIQSSDGGVLLLTGQVDSDEIRKLAANLARLEPGVRSIKNKLTLVGR